jgi:hypothetical protein
VVTTLRRLLRSGLLVGLVAGGVILLRRARSRTDHLPDPATIAADADRAPWPRLVPDPEPDPVPPPAGWVTPPPDGGIPDGYPVKAKDASKIFHVTGQMNYDRTTADRFYASPAAAEADGYRPAKR